MASGKHFDILQDISDAVGQAWQQGWTLRDFQKQLTPVLQAQGWWDSTEVRDPLTGTMVENQLGSPQGLQIVYDTCLRLAHAARTWASVERLKDRRPFLRYVAIVDNKTHPLHRQWNNTILPWDHPWWKTHFPPNSGDCRCTVQQFSQRDLAEFRYQVSEAPASADIPWTNKRTDKVSLVPEGIDPGFACNPGLAALEDNAARALMENLVDAAPNMAAAIAASAWFAARPVLLKEVKLTFPASKP